LKPGKKRNAGFKPKGSGFISNSEKRGKARNDATREVGQLRKIRLNPASLEWLGLRELTEYAAVSERTLRAWIHSPLNPLPASRIGGKFLVQRRVFDGWLRARTVKPAAVSVTAIQR